MHGEPRQDYAMLNTVKHAFFPQFTGAIAIACILAHMNVHAGVIWTQDFQTQTPGAAPSGPGITQNSNGSTRLISVVDSTTNPADPFGPAGNLSLVLEKTSTGTTSSPNIYFNLPETTAGILTFNAYSYQSSPDWDNPLLTVYMNDGSNIGVFALFDINNSTVVPSSGARTATNAWAVNSVNRVKIEFFDNQTYSISINDILLSFPTIGTVVPYYGAATSLDTLRIGIQDNARTEARVFVDNFVLTAVPEPGSVALLGIASIAILLVKRHKMVNRT